jgi:tetratricopeptide (TPR) repeat protein
MAEQALSLDPLTGEAHGSLGCAAWSFDWAWEEAEGHFLRGEELCPSYPQTRLWHSFLLASLSRLDEAVEEIERAWQFDPLSLVMQANVAAILHLARRHQDSIARLLRTLETDPEFVLANIHLARAYSATGKYELAIAALEKAASGFPLAMGALGGMYARRGRTDKALDILHQLEAWSRERYVGPIAMFSLYSGMGDVDAVIEQLCRAFDQHEGVVPVLTVDPALDAFRDHPKVRELLRSLNMPHHASVG